MHSHACQRLFPKRVNLRCSAFWEEAQAKGKAEAEGEVIEALASGGKI